MEYNSNLVRVLFYTAIAFGIAIAIACESNLSSSPLGFTRESKLPFPCYENGTATKKIAASR
jgi:hypothetical protein